MLATSVLFFVVSGIQFWGTDYMRLVLEMPEEIVYPAFSIITLTAPTLGCIVGGGLTHMMGGYRHPNAIKLILYVGLIGTIVSLPIPFVDHLPTFLTLFWLSLFSGGCIMPGMTGVMINSVPRRQKALANSIAYVSYNLLGYVPGPVIYGVITHFNGQRSKIGMFVLIYSLILCIILVWFAYRNSWRSKVTVQQLVHNVKEYKESEAGLDDIVDIAEEKKQARRKNRMLRYSMGHIDWNKFKGSLPHKEHSFLEDVLAANPSPSAARLNHALRRISLHDSLVNVRRISIQDPLLARRISDLGRVQSITRPRHKRGISLFDNDITNVGMPGQAAANLFQARQPRNPSKLNRRARSIFY